MGKIFYIIGKTSSGKDTIYEEIIKHRELQLNPLIMYTTRPIRPNEKDGVQYFFVTEEKLQEMKENGQVIELRSYHTVHGVWYYFTADSEAVDLKNRNYLAVGTLESYQKVKQYYGEAFVVPVYIDADDRLRLERYIQRESRQEFPNYEEVCRRFLSDQKDFSEENIRKAGISRRFYNNGDKEDCINQVVSYIRDIIKNE